MKKRFGLIAVFGLLAAVLTSCATKYTIEFVEKNGTEIFLSKKLLKSPLTSVQVGVKIKQKGVIKCKIQ